MNKRMKIIAGSIIMSVLILINACEKPATLPPGYFDCPGTVPLTDAHPKNDIYREILERNTKNGIIGSSLVIIDKYGAWAGSAGLSDIAGKVETSPCHRFMIASITKVFTATAIFSCIDDGLLSLDDPVNKWIDKDICDRIKNANESRIYHLLSHTSGLADYYTLQFELDRINRPDNNWQQEDILKYSYGKKPTNEVGETYWYSNTNFLLLGMILEKVSGKKLEDVYRDRIFNPLGLQSAWYSTKKPVPEGTAKGYADIYGNGQYIESEFLYGDELKTADGGIAINAWDLAIFFKKLGEGNIISETSYNEMTNWFDLPEDWKDENVGHTKNGYGLEYNLTPYGYSIGHTGGIDGFLSIAQYFPEDSACFILLVNNASYESEARLQIYRECMAEMFSE